MVNISTKKSITYGRNSVKIYTKKILLSFYISMLAKI